MSIQGSVNQLLGTVAAGAGLINHNMAQTRNAAAANTDAAMGHVAQMARDRGGEELAQSVEQAQRANIKNRNEYSNSIIGNAKATNRERSKASMYRSMGNNMVNTDHWRFEAQQRLEQQARHQSFMELVKNPNATQADFNEWRKK